MTKKVTKETFLELMDMPLFEEYTFWELLNDRVILLKGQVDDNIVERIIMQVIRFNRQDEHLPKEERKPITIYLNTPGGAVHIGLVLCDVISQSKTPVHIIPAQWVV